ncbi:MAG TPA: peptide chain release factor 1 [bacterium]|nr:peptide chain release factor 1 [bacterium]HOL47497.1 peptide chain release factor 1 [bacterium]HPQ19581.1 peptide chain release factor 1 [bacterium]
MIEKLLQLEEKYNLLQKRLQIEITKNNIEEWKKISKEISELEPVIKEYQNYKRLMQQKEECKELLNSNDSEFIELAKEDLKKLEEQIEKVNINLKRLLLPKDPLDEKNIIVEIRAGTGGEEAALFAADLFRMYVRYAEKQKWKVSIYDSNPTGKGGYKEIIFSISGKNVYSKMKYEGGVHRVQRVPETEAQGRIHTSAITVAVLPEMEEVEVNINPNDLKIDTYRASGCGGQHVNRTDSAVRITHIPTGIVVTCQDEKSQIKNRARAMSVLRARLFEKFYNEELEKRSQQRRIMVGTGDRSEKIRTYNYPQNRVTDHRINLTLYKLDQVLDGELDEIIENLILADEVEKMRTIA